jgi:hypothetical protein
LEVQSKFGYPSRKGLRHIIIAVIAATLAVAAVITPASADPVFLRTTAPLDVVRGYCIDIRGQGAGLRMTESL